MVKLVVLQMLYGHLRRLSDCTKGQQGAACRLLPQITSDHLRATECLSG